MEKNEWGCLITFLVIGFIALWIWWSYRHERRVDQLKQEVEAAKLRIKLEMLEREALYHKEMLKRQSLRAQGRSEEINE